MSDILDSESQGQVADSLISPMPPPDPMDAEPVEEAAVPVEDAPEQEQLQETEQETPDPESEAELPAEQQREYDQQLYEQYARRFNIAPQLLADPSISRLLKSKIDTDIYAEQQRQELAARAESFEPSAPVPSQSEMLAQHFAALDDVVRTRTNPDVAKAFHSDFLRAFGVPDSEIAKIAPEQAVAFTHTASKYMLNLVNTFLPDMLQAQLTQQLASAFPGFGEMYERSYHALAWDRVRNSDPALASLPAYGSRQFSEALHKAAASLPGIDQMKFADENGNPLSEQESVAKKYEMLARIAAGQNTDPALMQQAAAAGARAARRAEIRRSNGNLGSGQSSAGTPSRGGGRFQTNQDIFEDGMELYQRENGKL